MAAGRRIRAGPKHLTLEQRHDPRERQALLADGCVEQAEAFVVGFLKGAERVEAAEEALGPGNGAGAEPAAPAGSRIERSRGALQPAELRDQRGALGLGRYGDGQAPYPFTFWR